MTDSSPSREIPRNPELGILREIRHPYPVPNNPGSPRGAGISRDAGRGVLWDATATGFVGSGGLLEALRAMHRRIAEVYGPTDSGALGWALGDVDRLPAAPDLARRWRGAHADVEVLDLDADPAVIEAAVASYVAACGAIAEAYRRRPTLARRAA